jgi:hypothetical protein
LDDESNTQSSAHQSVDGGVGRAVGSLEGDGIAGFPPSNTECLAHSSEQPRMDASLTALRKDSKLIPDDITAFRNTFAEAQLRRQQAMHTPRKS